MKEQRPRKLEPSQEWKTLNPDQFLEKMIDLGIDLAKEDYTDNKELLEGTIDGFEACRLCELYDKSGLLNLKDIDDLRTIAIAYEKGTKDETSAMFFRGYRC